MPFAELGDRRISYLRRGTGGEPLLLITGMAAHQLLWGDELLDGLARDFDVVAFDHRGIGDSSDVPGDFTVTELTDDAVALLDALGWRSAHVLGFSLGGLVAADLAARHGDRVRSLVLAATFPGGGPRSDYSAPGPMSMFEAMQSGDVDVALRAAYAANLSATYTADRTRFGPFRDRSLAVRVPVPVAVRQAQAALTHDGSAALASITAPTLVLHGTADEMVRYGNGEVIAEIVPGARLHTLDGVGHLFWFERPDDTLRLIREHCLPAARSA